MPSPARSRRRCPAPRCWPWLAGRWREHLDDLQHWRPFRNVISLCEDTDGINRTVRLAGKPVLDAAGRAVGYRGTATDITAEIEAGRRAEYLAMHDPLTELPNRVVLLERIEQAIASVSRRRDMAALLILDLDRFKDVNDTLGHPAGDLLLQQVAVRLSACVREVDTVARIGGDEFSIVLAGIKDAADAQLLCRRLLETFQTPFDLSGHEVLATVSVGVALIPMDGSIPDQLLKHADIALYRAKEEGRNTSRFFEPEMDARLQRRKALERELRLALSRDELDPLLPAQDLLAHRRGGRHRGAGALAASRAGAGAADRVHRRRRGDRPDPRAWRVGAAHRLPPGRCLA